MSGGAKALIEEIRARHYSSTKKSKGKGLAAPLPERKSTVLPEPKESADYVKPKPNVRLGRKAKPGVKVPISGIENLFDVTIIGGIGLPGYPLNEGEKLAIVKLSPIREGK